MELPPLEPESSASANSAISANKWFFEILHGENRTPRRGTQPDPHFRVALGGSLMKPAQSWCERRDLNPYGITTRPSNVRVCRFRHSRESSVALALQHLELYQIEPNLSTPTDKVF